MKKDAARHGAQTNCRMDTASNRTGGQAVIVQPDLLRHWKTRKFTEQVGDPAAPLVLIRLWAHCQVSRRWEFPELKRCDLAAICEWDSLKNRPSSMRKGSNTRVGGLQKMEGGGYRVRGWEEHNKNLIANWKRNPSGKPKEETDTDPAGTPRAPHDVPDKTKPDQTKPDSIDESKSNPTRSRGFARVVSLVRFEARPGHRAGRTGRKCKSAGIGWREGGLDGLASHLAQKLTAKCGTPTLEQVRSFLRCSFDGAERFSEAFFNTMQKQHWQDKSRRPITDWRALAKSYASKCYLSRGKSAQPDYSKGF